MSCSVCIKCKAMVNAYEKYCPGCIDKYGVRQDETFHKRSVSVEQWPLEFQRDREAAKTEKLQTQMIEVKKIQYGMWNRMDSLCRQISTGGLHLKFSVSVLRKILRPEFKKFIISIM